MRFIFRNRFNINLTANLVLRRAFKMLADLCFDVEMQESWEHIANAKCRFQR